MLDKILFYLYEALFDAYCWPAIAPEYRQAAALVGFNLAFVTQLNPDDEPTLASKPNKKKSPARC